MGPCSAREVKKCVTVVISSCSLQRVTDRGGERQKPDRRRRTCKRASKRQVNVNARESQMIGNAVNDAAFATFPASQPRKLTIRIIERIREDMKHHARDVDAEITVKIKMSGNDAADTGEQGHSSRRHVQLREKLGQPKSYRPVKAEIENTFYLKGFISALDARMRRLF